jgi:hypothetical protein
LNYFFFRRLNNLDSASVISAVKSSLGKVSLVGYINSSASLSSDQLCTMRLTFTASPKFVH